MRHIQKDYKVKMYILSEFSANQNVVIVGERNDEDHAVPPVMMPIEKLTDEEKRIISSSLQLFEVPVPHIERIVEVVTTFHGSESNNESLHRSSTCQDTHKVVDMIILNLTQHVANAQDAKIVSRHDPAVNW